MKRKFILTGLFLLSLSVCAYEKVYLEQYPSNYQTRGYFNRTMRPMYQQYNNPYRFQYNQNPYNVQYYRTNTLKDRILNRLFNKYYNRLSFLNFNKNGTMTGYSTPISSDVYKELGIEDNNQDDNNNQNKNYKQRLKSPTCNTDLFSNPTQNGFYSKANGKRINDGGGTASKTGVTIIYD